MYQRYYIEPFFNHWVVKDREDETFLFGPFDSEADCYFVMQMLNNEKIKFIEDGSHGEEGLKEPHSIY